MAKDYHPPMHTAEHILNRTMVNMFNCGRSFSAHIEKKKSKVDYRFERDLTSEEKERVEQMVNDVIASDLNITEEYIPRSLAEQQFNLSKLPDDAGDPLRIIRIGDYDSCPCIGQHVHTTGEVGGFKIISTSFENGVLRLRYKLLQQHE